MTSPQNSSGEPDFNGMVLPDEGVVDLTDKLTEYMTEIELGGMNDIIGQVLDDFLDQAGSIPDDLHDHGAFEQITRNQLAVTLAYQLGRLEGRAPQVVERLILQAAERWHPRPVGQFADISDADLRQPKELVYPRLRRLEYTDPEDAQS
ncbi:MAG: hypothetical protein FJ316_08120 [SAR202 cluster bacterium]|nr:hypothetical protein [SAR202 cluster bacterium]